MASERSIGMIQICTVHAYACMHMHVWILMIRCHAKKAIRIACKHISRFRDLRYLSINYQTHNMHKMHTAKSEISYQKMPITFVPECNALNRLFSFLISFAIALNSYTCISVWSQSRIYYFYLKFI